MAQITQMTQMTQMAQMNTDLDGAGVRAFWVAAPGRGEIRAEALGAPGDGDIRVSTRFSFISRGTEALVFRGEVPVTEHERMRAPFQVGDFPAPVKYGYALVGDVVDGPADVMGRTVFILHPHQTAALVPAASAYLVPENVPASRAGLAANLETAINGIWDGGVKPGDAVSVFGGGTVGCLAAWVAGRIAGCEVELVDVNPHRAGIARALGVAFATPDRARADADVVIHASGTSQGLTSALAAAGIESTIVELSWYGDRAVSVPLGGAFHARRLRLQSSQVGTVPAAQARRWDNRRRMGLALRLLADEALDVLITGESAFDELPAVMARLASDPGNTICHRIAYPSPVSRASSPASEF